MTLATESITQPGSGLVFINYYDPGVTDLYRSAVVNAERQLEQAVTTPVTISVEFDLQSLGGQFAAQNSYATLNVTVTGGAGADTFHHFPGAGVTVVTDFNGAEGDRVQLDLGSTWTVIQSGADTLIDLGGGSQMILRGVAATSFQSNWIFLA